MNRNAPQHDRPHPRHRRQVQDRHTRDRTSSVVTLSARVRSVELTAQGRLLCVLDTSAGRLSAWSDAAGVHQSELMAGRKVLVVLLRLRRATEDNPWHWQLLGCRGAEEETVSTQRVEREGSWA